MSTTITTAEPLPANNHFPEVIAQRKKYGILLDLDNNEFVLPTYTIKQIYDAIPPKCFERNVLKSLSYVVQDICLLAITFYFFNTYATPQYVPSWSCRFVLWTFFTFFQGLFALGIWILGHEAGHNAMSTSKTFDDIIGLILHTSLLVPFYSWKFTHRNHHKATGNMHTDTSFVPVTRFGYAQRFGKTLENITEYTEDTPIYSFFLFLFHQLFDWHVYMAVMIGVGEYWYEKQAKYMGEDKLERNSDGTIKRKYGVRGGHFYPYSTFFTQRETKLIFVTDAALLIAFSVLYWIGKNYGWMNLLVWYGVPFLWMNHWLIAITYLHHSDGSLPHYNPSTWTFTRGAASTIDRDVGFVGRNLFHNIIDTHVLHHHISVIPHYHATEASQAIKPLMGIHYRSDHTGTGLWNFMVNYWKNAKTCSWVEASADATGEGKDVLFFRNRIGVGAKPVEIRKAGM